MEDYSMVLLWAISTPQTILVVGLEDELSPPITNCILCNLLSQIFI